MSVLDYLGDRRLGYGLLIMTLVSFAGAYPGFTRTTSTVTYAKERTAVSFRNDPGGCAYNGGEVIAETSNETVCFLNLNFTETSTSTQKVGLWTCLQYGNCW